MGNCLKRESRSMVWAGDDWGSITRSEVEGRDDHNDEDYHSGELQSLLGESYESLSSSLSSSSSSGVRREIKIKITKKQLEELVGTEGLRGLSASQILAKLMNNNQDHHFQMHDDHHVSWKPALQSIPEVN